MALNREPIYSALLAFITGAYAWSDAPSRRLRPIANIGASEQPTAFLICGKQEAIGAFRGQALKWKLTALLVIYARTDDPSQAPSSLLNPIVTALETALEQGAGDGAPAQFAPGQLGKANVLSCRITAVELVEGATNGQGSALVDIEMLAVA